MARLNGNVAHIVRCVVQQGAFGKRYPIKHHQTQCRTGCKLQKQAVRRAAGAALGLVVFYGVAFAESPLLHNAAHDVRHITVQPCH